MLELLLGHQPRLLAGGSLEMGLSPAAFALGAAAIAAAVAVLMGFTRPRTGLASAHRVALWALRSGLLVLLMFLLLDPTVQVRTREPVRGHVAVVVDDSLSMTIRDQGEGSRAEYLLQRLAPAQGDVAQALESRFDVRYLRFSNAVQGLHSAAELAFAGTRSRLDLVLDQLAEMAQGGALASVVIASDGAGALAAEPLSPRQHSAALGTALKALAARGVAVHTVGFGQARFDVDVELSDAVLAGSALRGDTMTAEISITHRGSPNQPLRLSVERDSSVVAQLPVILSKTSERTTVQVPLRFSEAGARRIVFRLQNLDGETLHENNHLTRLVQVRDTPIQVLHMEGEPRFEVKFLRRAVAADNTIRLRSLVRTAENKFYRLGIEDASELPDGLPASEEALFRYDAVVIGSLGSSLLDLDQQLRLQAFVARRGGGLVLLGGRNAFAEGGFSEGPMAALSPVLIPAKASSYRRQVRILPAVAPASDPLLRIAPEEQLDATWSRLPPLTMVNPIRDSKPGATTLLRGDDGGGTPLVVLAWHRYGRGTVAAFPVRDSWRWQMHADVPLDDMSHEHLWRALLRHVARPAGGRLRLALSRTVAAVGDTVRVTAQAVDPGYQPRPDAPLALSLTTPTGEVISLGLQRGVGADAGQQGSFLVASPGFYELTLSDTEGESQVLRAGLEVNATGDEFHAAELNEAALRRIAADTGGRFFSAAGAMEVVGALDDTRGYRQVQQDLSLREAPGLLLLLLLLACAEWAWRRRCALP